MQSSVASQMAEGADFHYQLDVLFVARDALLNINLLPNSLILWRFFCLHFSSEFGWLIVRAFSYRNSHPAFDTAAINGSG